MITVLARDHVGIIADVSRAMSKREGDIADLRESVLRGYLTMMLLATFPASFTPEAIRQRLLALNAQDVPPLDILVHSAEDARPATSSDIPPHAYVLTATGRDRIGFVASVSEFCARHNLNILDLATAVRIIPVPGKAAGDHVTFWGLFGASVILPIRKIGQSARFVHLGGRIPAPIHSLRN